MAGLALTQADLEALKAIYKHKAANEVVYAVEEENATKEIIQEIALYGLWRADIAVSQVGKACVFFTSCLDFLKASTSCSLQPLFNLIGCLI